MQMTARSTLRRTTSTASWRTWLGARDVVYVRPPLEHRWGQRVVRLYDPDRHIIEVGENMKSVCRRFRDQGMTPEQIAARMEVPLKFVTGCLR